MATRYALNVEQAESADQLQRVVVHIKAQWGAWRARGSAAAD
jgi:hypothetical protein